VPIGALAALGGAYASSVLPLLAASIALFLISGAAIAATPDTRRVDIPLLLFLGGMGLQAIPLPWALIDTLSPHLRPVMTALVMMDETTIGTLSLRPLITRETLASAMSVVLVFWGCRAVFESTGPRQTVRLLAWSGLVAALAGLAQRATAPFLLLWTWKPLDPAGRPFGPFVNRNHFAFWLLLAGTVTIGAAISHIQSHGLLQRRHVRQRLVDLLSDGTGIMLLGAAAMMWLTLIASTSRGAMLGLAVTCLIAMTLAGRRVQSRATFRVGVALVVALLGWGVWANVGPLVKRLDPNSGEVQRLAVWQDTVPILRDFPVTGTGAGTFGTAMLHYQRQVQRVLFNEAHSEYLQLVTEGGLLLTLPVLAALVGWMRLTGRRLLDSSTRTAWLRLGALAGLTGVGVQCLWDSALRMPANAMLVALVAALAVHQRTEPADSGDDGTRHGRGREFH